MPRALCLAYHLDWQRILQALNNAGYSLSKLAGQIGCDYTVLQRIASKTLAEPRFSVACALLDLHERLCGDQHDIPSLKRTAALMRQEHRAG